METPALQARPRSSPPSLVVSRSRTDLSNPVRGSATVFRSLRAKRHGATGAQQHPYSPNALENEFSELPLRTLLGSPHGPGLAHAALFETSNLSHRPFKYVEIMVVCGRSRLEPYAPAY
jgi:hypothetical protein